MSVFDVELVGKIGSMALIRRGDDDIDYNIFSRLGKELKPGMIWVSSGATEIGRLDYFHRNGREIEGDKEEVKADYASQGQAILMENYRRFIPHPYSVRQVLVEHQHFNDPVKREFIRRLLIRCRMQNAIPIVNYNDSVSFEENRKWELGQFREKSENVVECIDNDETASVIATLVKAKTLLILTSVEGIYKDVNDPSTIVPRITGKDIYEVLDNMHEMEASCVGASRAGANGAKAKLTFVKEPVKQGTTVIIGHARHSIKDLLEGNVERTVIGVS